MLTWLLAFVAILGVVAVFNWYSRIEDRLEKLEGKASRVAALEARLLQLEKQLQRQVIEAPTSQPPEPSPTPAPIQVASEISEIRVVERPGEAESQTIPVAEIIIETPVPLSTVAKVEAPMPTVQAVETRSTPWTQMIFGGNLFAKVALLIVFIGVAFLVRYVAEHVTVPISLRLAGTAFADLGLLLFGIFIRNKRRDIGLPVQGTALAILMLVTFASYRIYDLIPSSAAFVLLLSLTAFTCILAVAQDSFWLALFGIAGGFATPLLASSGSNNYIGLFSYYALLNTGILSIALKKSWRALNAVGFLFTFVIGTLWGVFKYESENYLPTQFFLILFFLFYSSIALIYALREQEKRSNDVDGLLTYGTPFIAFALQYGLVRHLEFGTAFSAVGLGLFYALLAMALWRREGLALRKLLEGFLGLGILFGTVAIPLALSDRWTSGLWALEGALLVWLGVRQKEMRLVGFGIFVQLASSLAISSKLMGGRDNPFLWLNFGTLAVAALSIAWLFRQHAQKSKNEAYRLGSNVFLILGTAWALLTPWWEIHHRLRSSGQAGTWTVASGMVVALTLLFVSRKLVWNMAQVLALMTQALTAILFGASSLSELLHPYWIEVVPPLTEGKFFGAAMLSVAAFLTAKVLARAEEELRPTSRVALVWGALWWIFATLPHLAEWAGFHLEFTLLRGEPSNFQALNYSQGIYWTLLALTAVAALRVSSSLRWADLRWLGYIGVFGFSVASHRFWEILLQSSNPLPNILQWTGFGLLCLAIEYGLKESEKHESPWDLKHPRQLRAVHFLRTASPWVLLWPLGHRLLGLWLNHAVDFGTDVAQPSGSWSYYLPTWVMMGLLAWLFQQAKKAKWPTRPISEFYLEKILPGGVVLSIALVAFWNATQDGRMAPLPYLPLLNPLDLTTGFAFLLGLTMWKQLSFPKNVRLSFFLGVLPAFLWLNLMLLRTCAVTLDLPYNFEVLFRNSTVQALLSLTWTLSALLGMLRAVKKQQRTPWVSGAVLLLLVVLKLFFVDMSHMNGIVRIVTFIGVGLLMLAIGYLAPFPLGERPEELRK